MPPVTPVIYRPSIIPYSEGSGAANPRWNGLAAGWKMNEYSDGSSPVPRSDVLGICELSDVNTVRSDTGVINLGAKFTAADVEYLTTLDHPNLSPTSDYTAILFLKMNDVSGAMVPVNKDDMGSNRSYSLYMAGGSLYNYTFDSVGGYSTASVSVLGDAGLWLFIGFGFRSSDGKAWIYKNTAMGQDGTPIIDVKDGTAPFEVGTRGAGLDPLDGMVDNLYLFHESKDVAWLVDMYNGGAGREYPN